MIIIVDIDGTVSRVGDRVKYLSEKPVNWDAFYDACFEDEPIIPIIRLVHLLAKDYEIVFLTGRRESVRDITVKWLNNYFHNREYHLLMRPNGDHRHDTEIKPELLRKANISLRSIELIIEDRNSMVKKWRELGLTCLQPAEGDF